MTLCNSLMQTVNQRAVGLTGTRPYYGTTNAPAAMLTIAKLVGADSVWQRRTVGRQRGELGHHRVWQLVPRHRSGNELHPDARERFGDHHPSGQSSGDHLLDSNQRLP